MKHLFIPYEIALKLKELGFNEECFGFYNNHPPKNHHPRGLVIEGHQDHNEETEDDDLICSAPLYQQVVDWLRDKHGIEVQHGCRVPVEAIKAAGGKIDHLDFKYNFYLYSEDRNPKLIGGQMRGNDYYQTLSKVIEEALKLIP